MTLLCGLAGMRKGRIPATTPHTIVKKRTGMRLAPILYLKSFPSIHSFNTETSRTLGWTKQTDRQIYHWIEKYK